MDPITWIILGIVALVLIMLTILVVCGVKNASNWLLFAVTEAEKALGSGTGELKLATVYDQFVTKFPVVKNFVSFNMFTAMVDKALEKMKTLAVAKQEVANYIENK